MSGLHCATVFAPNTNGPCIIKYRMLRLSAHMPYIQDTSMAYISARIQPISNVWVTPCPTLVSVPRLPLPIQNTLTLRCHDV